jgi:hypothetical protein
MKCSKDHGLVDSYTRCGSYFWKKFGASVGYLNVVYDFIAFHIKYSQASADAKTKEIRSIALMVWQQ